MIYIALATNRYASSIAEAKTYDARTVIQSLKHIQFCADYESTYTELNT